MLLGYNINVFIDHLNLVHETTLKTSDRVMRWKLLLEEFGITTTHVKGEDNTVSDAISRLDREDPGDSGNTQTTNEPVQGVHPFYQEVMNSETLTLEEEEFPLSLEVIYRVQQNCRATQRLAQEKGYKKVVIDTLQLVVTDKNQLVIPEAHQNEVLNWYHYFLNHPGETRMEQTMRAKIYWKGMTNDIKHFVKTCHVCKKFKKNRQKFGQLPLKDITQDMIPGDVVKIDTVGPYTVTSNEGKTLHLSCKTMIDPATGWFEMKEMKDTNNSTDAARIFNNMWLSRYP